MVPLRCRESHCRNLTHSIRCEKNGFGSTEGLKEAFTLFQKGAPNITGAELKTILCSMGEHMREKNVCCHSMISTVISSTSWIVLVLTHHRFCDAGRRAVATCRHWPRLTLDMGGLSQEIVHSCDDSVNPDILYLLAPPLHSHHFIEHHDFWMCPN